MLKLSNFKSNESQITLNIEIEKGHVAALLPKVTDIGDLKESYAKFVKELVNLQVIVSHGGAAIDNYREERSSGIAKLTSSVNEIFDKVSVYKTALKSTLNDKSIQEELSNALEGIDSLTKMQNEYEILAGIRIRLADFLKLSSENFEKKLRFYRVFNKLVNGEIRGSITLEGEYDYTFEVHELPVNEIFDNAALYACYKEFMAVDIGIPLGQMIDDLMGRKRILKKLMFDKFNPWDTFEDILTVEEFLKARAEIANYWNEEFSFTENLAHHYFKCQGFYQFFEDKLLEKLNTIKAKIDQKIVKIQYQYDIKESVLSLYGHLSVSGFLNGGNLRLVTIEGIPKPRHHSYNILRASNEKLAKIIWNETEKSIAKKLGGVIAFPGVIIRANKQDNKGTMKSELIVISNGSEDPKSILNGKFRDVISTKAENLTEIVEIEHKPDGITVDLDLRLSYFLTTSKAA